LCPDATVNIASASAYRFYRDTTSHYSSTVYSAGAAAALTSYSYGQGLFLYNNSKLLNTSSKPDYQAQCHFEYYNSSIASTSYAIMKLYSNPDTGSNSDEIAVRVEIPENGNPTSYLYKISNHTESTSQQITSLPYSLVPLFKNGGLMEMYYSQIGGSNVYVESYFTPTSDQNQPSRKSYLLGNSIMTGFGTTSVGTGFGYYFSLQSAGYGTVTINELSISQGKNNLSLNLGDCLNDNNTNITPPVVSIDNDWITSQNQEYIILGDYNNQLTVTTDLNASYFEVQKIDSANTTTAPSIIEVQLYKPSLSSRCSLEVDVRHRTDDFYIALSPKSSYRPHVQNNLQVEWDKPMGSRCLEDYLYSSNPIDAATILIKFSKDKNAISILQRAEDNSITKTLVRSYSPSNTNDIYVIELTDQSPNYVESKFENSTYIYIKTKNGSNINLLGYSKVLSKTPVATNGMGYYAACGFVKSSFDNSSGTTYNRINSINFKTLLSANAFESSNYNSIRTVSLAPEGLDNNLQYMGQKLLSGATDFQNYNYTNPVSSSSEIEIAAASVGSNVDLSNISSATIDGVVLSSLPLNSYILLKDQNNTSENGIYEKTGTSTYTLATSNYNTPYLITSGTVNLNVYFYKIKTQKENTVQDLFLSTSYFAQLTIEQISNFISSIRANLFEFRMNYLNYVIPIDQNKIKIRFYSDIDDVPDYDTPLTNLLEVSSTPLTSGFAVSPNNSLIQVIMENDTNLSPLVSSGDKIWVQILLPFNTALANAYGKESTQQYITSGKFTFYKLANNLWHRLFATYTSKFVNTTHGLQQHVRLRSISHAKLESNATNMIGPSTVDILGPQYQSANPKIDNVTNDNLRSIELSILAEDNDSGILAFRVGRYIDNYRSQYTPWMSWNQFTTENNGKYFIYLYGNLNYYSSGIANSVFDVQNIGYSGARKIWVQLMDYVGNVTQSYPLTFVAQSWALVDTQPPIANASFYDPRTEQNTDLTNLISSVAKLEAYDNVSGVKDFKMRRILDSGADSWSNWEYMSSYKNIDFSGEYDGIKKVEFVFRDFGNNAMQAENIWEKVKRPKK
jgi:hypothetical protein